MKYCENCHDMGKCEMYGGCWNPPAKEKPLCPSDATDCSALRYANGSLVKAGDVVKINNAVSVESTALFALLESRHETMLQWCEPWPACGPEGNDLDAHVILRATVHDCINMQRRVAKAAGRPTMGDDGNHLLDFMAIHWTRVVEANADVRDRPA
jgi:hypothetical protein